MVPGKATIGYAMPMPDDSPMGGASSADVALKGGVRSIGYGGGPIWTVDGTVFEMWLGQNKPAKVLTLDSIAP